MPGPGLIDAVVDAGLLKRLDELSALLEGSQASVVIRRRRLSGAAIVGAISAAVLERRVEALRKNFEDNQTELRLSEEEGLQALVILDQMPRVPTTSATRAAVPRGRSKYGCSRG